MDKLDAHQKAHELRHAFLQNKRRVSRKKKGWTGNPRSTEIPGEHGEIVALPEHLDLSPNNTHIATALRHLKTLAFKSRKKTILDLRSLTSISPIAALYLVANTHLTRRSTPSDRRPTGTYPRSKEVESQLSQMGFFELLKVTERRVDDSHDNKFIRFLTGTIVEGEEIERLQDRLRSAGSRLGSTYNQQVYRAASEAMTNTVHHAYIDIGRKRRYPTEKNRWWLLGSVDEQANELTIIFCDLGWGIPSTLAHTTTGANVLQKLKGLELIPINHGKVISEAIKHRRTRTDKEHRGKGLNDLWSLIEKAGAGKLEIYSDAGWVQCEPGGKIQHARLKPSIEGTIISWTVPNTEEFLVSNQCKSEHEDDFHSEKLL